MEVKQIYTTAKSDELKRSLIKYKQQISGWLKKLKERKYKWEKTKKPAPHIPAPTPPHPVTSNREKNLDAIEALYSDMSTKRDLQSSKVRIPKDKYTDEHLKYVITYTLFGLIVLFIIIGIYLTYATK